LYVDSWMKDSHKAGDIFTYRMWDPNSDDWHDVKVTYYNDEEFLHMTEDVGANFQGFWDQLDAMEQLGAPVHVSGSDYTSLSNRVEAFILCENKGVTTIIDPCASVPTSYRVNATMDEVKDQFHKDHKEAVKKLSEQKPQESMSFRDGVIQGAGLATGTCIVMILLEMFNFSRRSIRVEARKTVQKAKWCFAEKVDPGCAGAKDGTCTYQHDGAKEHWEQTHCMDVKCLARRRDGCRMRHSTAQIKGKGLSGDKVKYRKAESKELLPEVIARMQSMKGRDDIISEEKFENMKKAIGVVNYSYIDAKGENQSMFAQCFHARDKIFFMHHYQEFSSIQSVTFKFPLCGWTRDLDLQELADVRAGGGKKVRKVATGMYSHVFAVHPRAQVPLPQLKIGPVPCVGSTLWFWSWGNVSHSSPYVSIGKCKDVRLDGSMVYSCATDKGNCGGPVMSGGHVVGLHLLGDGKGGEYNEGLVVSLFH